MTITVNTNPTTTNRGIVEGDILVMEWGYDANNVNYFKVLRRTTTMVEIAELQPILNYGETGVYQGSFAIPSDVYKNWSVWSKRDRVQTEEHVSGNPAPIKFRRKITTTTDGREVVWVEQSYGRAVLWNGEPRIDYNHH